MSVVIQVEKLSKCYSLGTIGGGTLRADVSRWLAKLQGKPDPNLKIGQENHARLVGAEFWALQDVTFEVKQGEILGIIGRNGAGKSTLLKILSRVTAPTSGEVRVKGRIASLLEVGTGFHPELTGRENIFLNGAILGMTKAEIRKKLDEIVAFSGVEEFIDTPVKRYSSGMYVRLAFAVAAHLEPDILIIDEVLAVGDAEFQNKCLGKMREVSEGGRTVLFVSHNMEALLTLTTRSILLTDGRISDLGSTRDIVARYLNDGNNAELVYMARKSAKIPTVTRVQLHTSAPNNIQHHADTMEIEMDCYIPHPIRGARFEVHACDERLQRILNVHLYDGGEVKLFHESGEYTITCRIPKIHLYAGRYTLLVHLAESFGGRVFQKLEGICPFQVIMCRSRDGGWVAGDGMYLEDTEWTLQQHQ